MVVLRAMVRRRRLGLGVSALSNLLAAPAGLHHSDGFLHVQGL